MRRLPALALLAAATLVLPIVAAHAERPTLAPVRPGTVPDPDRAPTAVLDVCKKAECAYGDIQAAVHAAPDGALIRIWPGLYRELPSRAAPSLQPDVPDMDGVPRHYSYQHHVDHPNSQNLVAIVGKKDITLRGMGDEPSDVTIDVAFAKHVGIRADRSDGVVIQNLAVYHAYDHNVYVLDQDGFLIEDVESRWAFEYDFLMFAVDHGILRDCVAEGAGDAGIYPGGTAEPAGRFSVEVTGCKSFHNVLGYSGTQGNHVWVHGNEFYDNGLGLVSDSETDHPNYPQKGSLFEDNVFRDNNFDYMDGDCSDGWCSDVRPTVFVGGILLPIGTGIFLASNNDNVVRDNEIYDHDRYGVWLASGQGVVLGPTSTPAAAPFVSSGNRFVGNVMAGPGGTTNDVDFAWDGLGPGNCWQDNVRGPGEPATGDTFLPPCEVEGTALPTTPMAPNVPNLLQQVGLVYVEDADGNNRPLCHWIGLEPCTGGATDPKNGLPVGRNTLEGYVAPPTPPTCGPSDDPSCWE